MSVRFPKCDRKLPKKGVEIPPSRDFDLDANPTRRGQKEGQVYLKGKWPIAINYPETIKHILKEEKQQALEEKKAKGRRKSA